MLMSTLKTIRRYTETISETELVGNLSASYHLLLTEPAGFKTLVLQSTMYRTGHAPETRESISRITGTTRKSSHYV